MHVGESVITCKQDLENSSSIYISTSRYPDGNCLFNTYEENYMINKAIFEEKWKMIRSQATAWWSLMTEYDLVKVDKADVKFDKFATMLQVKYGFTRQQAREEINRLWTEYEANSKKVTA